MPRTPLEFSLRHLAAALVCCGCAAGAAAQTTPVAPAQQTRPATAPQAGGNTAVPQEDREFMEKAAMGGMTEVELGGIARRQAASESVKNFGNRMVEDHSKANDELKQIAQSKGVQLPSTLDAKHRQDVEKFSKMQGAAFDRAYMKHMVEDHKKDIDLFQKEATSGKDDQVKAFAAKTLPTLQEHLKLAESIRAEVEKSKK